MPKRPPPSSDDVVSPKRARSNNGSPAPMPPPFSDKPDMARIIAEAKARAAALARGNGSATAPHGDAAAPAKPASSAASRLAELRARVAAAVKPAAPEARPPPPPPQQQQNGGEDLSRARGGLGVGLHPALLGDAFTGGKSNNAQNSRNNSTPPPERRKQLDLSAPSAAEIKNPYYDPTIGSRSTAIKPRPSRQLEFNEQGKYMAQAAALRRQAALEAMKKKIAESARKAGIDEELDIERAFMVERPPEIEWWDEAFVKGDSYDHIEEDGNLKIDSEDSIITLYIQHPILIEPPQDKNIPAPKPMYMTAKEMAKQRRQRRMAEHKEQQAKIRLGLEPAPAPKVGKKNLWRVLGEEAVRDPTAVEARVNREIEERHQKHVEENEDRKLTKEQRLRKLAKNQAKDAAKGIICNVYKIDNLASGKHRFQISKNAEQQALTGVCIMHPKFSLVIVEGGTHSIKFYKKLMLNRIQWTINTPTPAKRYEDDVGSTTGLTAAKQQEAMMAWLKSEDEKGELRDLSLNKCTLLWEGELKARAFRKWASKVCETDGEAKDILGRAKMENFWTLAKNKL